MKIGEIVRRTGTKASAIRFYEERGLLPSVGRGSNGYRDYSEDDVERLERIKIGKALGFSIDEMRAYIAHVGNASRPDLLRSLDQRLAGVNQMMRVLQTQRRDLLALRKELEQTWSAGQCFKASKAQATSNGAARPA